MWDQRYSAEHYIYGTEPNTFLAEHAGLLRGPVLSLAEGEGRNAVYLAKRGLAVLGVDSSTVGLRKAQRLASRHGVKIETQRVDLADFCPEPGRYGAVVSIFAHLPSALRARLYPLVAASLAPGGLLLLEAYTPAQLGRDTGGPKDVDLLLGAEELARCFAGLETILLREIEREVIEGTHHTGLASVVQFIAAKPG